MKNPACRRCALENKLTAGARRHFCLPQSSSSSRSRCASATVLLHEDEIAEAEAQGLPYMLVPRELSREEWEKEYCHAPAAEEKKD